MSDSSTTANSLDPLGFIAKPTPMLRAAITQHQQHLPPADFAGLIAVVRSAFQKYTRKLLEFEPGADRASVVHALVDREAGSAAQIKVSCQRGCSGCCHYEVDVTRDEAAMLAALVRAGCEIDRERLAVQAARERRSPKWLEFLSKDNRCVFLDDGGECRVYSNRPASCRKLFVTTAPEACTAVGGQPLPVQMLLVEILLSAAVSIADTPFASLPKMLQAELEDRQIDRVS